ncbi:cardiotoxin 7''-like [Clavelina lepadiformis]|uniref:cardiotoxin 7''-like n=1 Tax=Clavelina lepadiformis TaxID=159417 RepID=UPI0040430AF1
MKIFPTLILVAFALLPKGRCIRCYNCSNPGMTSCLQPARASASLLVTCPEGENFCFTTTIGSDQLGHALIRGCSDGSYRSCLTGHVTHCTEVCTTDGCNGGGRVVLEWRIVHFLTTFSLSALLLTKC